MPSKKAVAIRLHAVTIRFLPATISFLVLIPMIPALAFMDVADPATWLGFLGFTLAGLVFIYDGLVVFPAKKGEYLGVTASAILFIIGGANIVFGLMVWFGWFNPFVGNSEFTPWATVTLGLGVGALFFAGLFELIAIKFINKEGNRLLTK